MSNSNFIGHCYSNVISEITVLEMVLKNIKVLKVRNQQGENNPNWKGGRYIDDQGYVQIYKPEYPFSRSNGYVLEHRYVYEQHYNVCLLSWIDVHHINEDKLDNRIENLVPLNRKDHRSYHMKKREWKLSDMSNRICYKCNSGKTTLTYTLKRPKWYKNDNGYLCSKCYQRLRYANRKLLYSPIQ